MDCIDALRLKDDHLAAIYKFPVSLACILQVGS